MNAELEALKVHVTNSDRAALSVYFEDKTREFAILNGFKKGTIKAKKEELSTKAKEMLRVITEESKFDSYEAGLVRVLELLTEEPLTKYYKAKAKQAPEENIKGVFGALFVPTANNNSHNYLIGEVAVVALVADRVALRSSSMTLGNRYPGQKEDLRPATEEEITTFIDGLLANPRRAIESIDILASYL